MRRYVLILMLVVVVAKAYESSTYSNRKKWSERRIFPGKPVWGPSPNVSTPSSEIPSISTNKPATQNPIWNFGKTWGVDRPRWGSPGSTGSTTPGSRVDKPRNINGIEPVIDDSCVPTHLPLTVDSKCCGIDAISNHRIIGGNVTHIEEHPWLVQIEYQQGTVFKRLCGGSLISNRYVLSAAHCFKGAVLDSGTPVNVILGEYDTTNEVGKEDCVLNERGTKDCTDGAIKVPIEAKRIHYDYWSDNFRNLNDIALIRLGRPVEYTKFIRPICLPSSDVTVSPPVDLRFITAGWGAIYHELIKQNGKIKAIMEFDDIKRHVDVPLYSNTLCREQFRFLTERHMCAGGEAGKDSCKGDSGGPLMHQRDGVFEAVGIVSTASGRYACGTKDHVAVYTNVYQYRDWINQQITMMNRRA